MAEQSLKLSSWNIRDGLSDQSTVKDVVESVVALDADIVALPEAYHEEANPQQDADKAEVLANAVWNLASEGYSVRRTLYRDIDGRKDRHGFVLLSRLDTTQNPVSVVSLGSRRSLRQHVSELALDVTGVHLDDRSEARRQDQAGMLLAGLTTERSVIIGDGNGMHRDDSWARRLRFVRPIVPRIQRPATIESFSDKLKWKASLATRLTDMADGGTMAVFARHGYFDVDEKHQATKGPVQLDHILANFAPDDDIAIGDYRVEDSKPGTSDHKPISAVITY